MIGYPGRALSQKISDAQVKGLETLQTRGVRGAGWLAFAHVTSYRGSMPSMLGRSDSHILGVQ